MKKILFIALISLSVFLIYLSTIDRKVFFLTLSSTLNEKEPYYNKKLAKDLQEKKLLEKYVNQFNEKDGRVTDFIRMIQNNKTIVMQGKKQSIKNALIKADVVILDVGKVDLFSKLAYEKEEETLYGYVDTIAEDVKDLLELMRVYCKEDIYILKIYNPLDMFPKEIIEYMNDKIKTLSKAYKIHYVDYAITSDMIENKIELNQKGEATIYQKLQPEFAKTLFTK
ncbi:MAG: SGNH/GDSL hydrolase family protein [Bacilli bacterium]|nr:SGNH/GDSL hydrolase family protein [Bacilli bacterium]